MIPNILYSILNGNNNNNNNSNNDNDDPNDENTYENNLGSRNIHLHDSTHLDQIIVSQQQQQQLQQLQQQMQDLQLQDGEGQAPMTPTTSTTSTNQSVFNNNNLRFGTPLCILRAPPDFVVPSAYENSSEQQQQQQQQPLSAILLPPNYNPLQSDKFIETAKTFNETSGGKFADKYSLHVIPVENNNNLFINRISYNTQTNAYYENGDLSNKYLKRWEEGAYQYDNIDLKIEYDWMKTYLARVDRDERMNDDGEISWKFDYRTAGGYIINSLNLELSFGTFDNLAKVQWFIKLLPTMKNPDPTWQLIQIDEYTEDRHEVKEIKNVTQFVKNEYGFILKAHLSGGVKDGVAYQKSQLFRQNWSRVSAKNIDIEDDETFGLDIKVELKPEIIVDPLPELFVLNDKSTSDFVIHYNFSNTTAADNQDINNSDNIETNETKDFHVHSMLLSKRSDYFSALLDSKMVESQNKSLTLTDADISYESLEIILNYLYTGKLPDIKSYDEWATLLRYSSRFLVPTLIQRCEKALKDYLNHDNLNEIETIAGEYGAEQLLHCCEGFEPAKK